MIREVAPQDCDAILGIYNHYVRSTTVTFEEEPLEPAEMGLRIRTDSPRGMWLVHEEDSHVVGYACAKSWHSRASYTLSVETSIYLHPEVLGRGIGSLLYEALLQRLRLADWHVAVGVIALPNPASIALHERLGFRKVGHLPEIGRKLGR